MRAQGCTKHTTLFSHHNHSTPLSTLSTMMVENPHTCTLSRLYIIEMHFKNNLVKRFISNLEFRGERVGPALGLSTTLSSARKHESRGGK
jgi:hypothetical protein